MIGAITAGLFSTGAAPAAATSYDSIATVSASGSSVVTFSSIPSTYKHLQLRCFSTPSGASYNYLRLNSDTGSNYSFHQLTGDGSTAGAAGGASQNLVYINNYSSTQPAVAIIDILDYQNTNKNKTIRSLAGVDSNGAGYVQFRSGAWYNTAAVSTITITVDGGTYSTGSSFALYGIKG